LVQISGSTFLIIWPSLEFENDCVNCILRGFW
jgi:hypothetical protein